MKFLFLIVLAGFSLANCGRQTESTNDKVSYNQLDTIPPQTPAYTYPPENASGDTRNSTGMHTADPVPQVVGGTETTTPETPENKAAINDGRSNGNMDNSTTLDPDRGVGSGKDGRVTGDRSPQDPKMRTSGNGGNGNINSASSGRDYKRATKSGGDQ
ncbi:MAG: hypothetical protein ABIO24_03220 [Saprospiraceae bacterium]